MAKSYAAQLRDIEAFTKQNLRYIASEAIQDVMEDATETVAGVTRGGVFEVGKLPVNLGELVGSLSVDGGAPSDDSYVLALAGYEVGGVMNFAWTAPHALPVEVGVRGNPGRHFVSTAAKRFEEHVAKRAAEVK